MTYPLALRAWDSVENYGDPLLNTWILAWDVHQLLRDPLRLFQANSFHPYSNTLAYSENLLAIAALGAPFLLLTGNPIWVHNLLLLFSFIMCGWTAYLLVYDQSRSWAGGLVAGTVYAFAHYRWGHISHLQLLSAQWLPLVLLYLRHFIRRGWRPRHAVLAAGFFILQALSCTYYAFYAALTVLLYLLYALIARRLSADRRLLWGAVALGAALLILTPVMVPYLHARAEVGEFELEAQSGARLVAWISAAKGTPLGSLPPFNAFGRRSEHTFFPGLVPLLLAVGGLLQRQIRLEKRFYVALTTLAWVLALGPELRLIGGQGPIFRPLPYALLYHLPGFSAMRVPARLGLLVMLGIAVLAGWGAVELHRRAGRWGAGLVLALIALIVVSYYAAPLSTRPIAVGAEVPVVYRWLAAQATGSAVVELPSASSIWFLKDGISLPRLARQQYFSTYHWQPMLMGYSGMYPPAFGEHIDHLLHFPSRDGLAYLRGLDVHYVVIHWDELSGEERHALERGLRRFAEELTPVAWLGSDQVYALPSVERKAPAVELYCPPTAPPSGLYYAYLLAQTGEERAFVSLRPTRFRFQLEWRDEEGRLERREQGGTLPLTIGPGTTVVPLAISRPPAPDSRLTVEAQVLGRTIHARQMVRGTTTASSVGIPDLRGELLWVEQRYEEGLILSHVTLPWGREYAAGDTVNVILAWRNEIEGREHVPAASVQIFDPAGNRVAQRDMVLANGLYRQKDWRAGEVILDRHLLTLSPWLPPGEYELLVSLYETQELHALGPRVHVGTIRVQRPPFDPGLIEHRRWARLGEEIALLGYSLSETQVQPGDRVALTLFWRALSPIGVDYTVFTHVLGPQGVITQADGYPCGGAYPTSQWAKDQVVEDRYSWTIPQDLAPGEYPIEVGMYLLDTGERLPVFNQQGERLEEDRVLLGSLTVVSP